MRVRATHYAVVAASHAAETLGQVQRRRPDLVLLDVTLPDHDGCCVCRVRPVGPYALTDELDWRLS